MHSSDKPHYSEEMSQRREYLIKKSTRLTRRARVFLFWEQYSPVFALAAGIIAVFLIGSFSGLWQWIGDPWRLILLVISIFYLVKAIRRARQFRPPNRSAAMRRVESDSDVSHRPLDTLHDTPALSKEGWTEHYAKSLDEVQRLVPPKLRPELGKVDKYYLRYILPVCIGLAIMIGTGDSLERLRHSLTPGWVSGAMGDQITFEAWIDPPAYTGRPPIYFKNADRIEVPEGSELVARIIGTKDPTRPRLTTPRGSTRLALTRIGPDSFEARAIVKRPGSAIWRIGQTEKEWKITALADQPPEVSFVREPEADKRDRLIFAFAYEDDYGIDDLQLRMTLLQDDMMAPEQIRDVRVPLGGNARQSESQSAALDLTKHEWAGRKVSARLIATDGRDQSAKSDQVYFTVPDKIFIEPMAKAIIEHRNLIMAGTADYTPLPRLTRKQWRNRPWFDTYQPEFRLERAPVPIQRAATLIDVVTDSPRSLFKDPAVYIGLRHVASRLRYAREQGELTGLPEDLWDIAIRAEFGILGTALEEMREAEAALRDGIARRAPQREIDTLFDRYNEAVDRYREELMRKAIEEGNMAEGGGGGGQGVDMDQIQELLDAIEEANRLGDSEGARRALAQLAELLENMQIQLAQGGGGGGGQSMPGQMSEEMQEALEELADLLGEQRELRDETREAERAEENQAGDEQGDQGQQAQGQVPGGNENQDGGPGGGAMSEQELADAQGRLQELLDKAETVLPEPGEDGEIGAGTEDGEDGVGIDPEQSLEDARRAMGQAEDALRQGRLGSAQDNQQAAIEALRDAGRALAEQAQREAFGDNQEAANESGDPLGRENEDGGLLDDNNADLDSRDNATRSRELQEEIRRRAAEQEREQQERDYLERLLKRF